MSDSFQNKSTSRGDVAERQGGVFPPLVPGTVLDGNYELLRPLGEGGMGVVWLAGERSLNREVAVKVMRPADGTARLRRFEREARALAALDHPSILPVLHTGIDEASGLPYLVTRAILLTPAEIHHLCHDIFHCPHPRRNPATEDAVRRSPDSLRARESGAESAPLSLADLLEGGKQLPEAAVLRIARDLAGALAAAHAAGILHRDIKPSNILFEPSGRAILSDFGLAKFTRGETESHAESAEFAESLVTRPSSLVTTVATARQWQRDTLSLDESGRPKFIGSPSYAAPEALREGAASASPALDWYSFGAVLHEALTGDPPRALRPLSSYASGYLSRFWDPFLRDLLEPDPARRLQDSAAIFRALDRIARHPARTGFRSRLYLWLLALALLVFSLSLVTRHSSLVTEAAKPPPPSHQLVTRPSALVPTVSDETVQSRQTPSPIPSVRGVVQSAAWPNPVTDFSKPSTDSAEWLSVPAALPAGTERRLPLGSEPDRLRLLWCPPDPDIAPEGFWILAEPISAQLASDIHNHLADSRDTPVWRPETDNHSASFDRKTAVAFLTHLSILTGFFGQHGPEEADAPVAHFDLPSNAQLYHARRVCPPGTLAITGDYPWTAESMSAISSDAFAPILMPLQPILVRASRSPTQP